MIVLLIFLIGGLEHLFTVFFDILEIMIPTDQYISEGLKQTNQIVMGCLPSIQSAAAGFRYSQYRKVYFAKGRSPWYSGTTGTTSTW